MRSGFPSGVLGTPAIGRPGHCAASGRAGTVGARRAGRGPCGGSAITPRLGAGARTRRAGFAETIAVRLPFLAGTAGAAGAAGAGSTVGAIPAIGGILVFFWAIIAAIIHIAFVVLWIIATVKAFTGVRWDIPYAGPIARKQVGES